MITPWGSGDPGTVAYATLRHNMRRRSLTWHAVDPASAPSIWAFFARPPSTARLRHPTDIVIVVAGLLALSIIGLLHAVDVDAFADAFSIGRALTAVLRIIVLVPAAWAVVLIAASAIDPGRRGRLPQAVLAPLAAVGLALIVNRGGVEIAGWSSVASDGGIPIALLAPCIAVITVVSPMLVRPWRYFGRLIEGSALLGCVLLTDFGIDSVLAAFIVGMVAAAIVHLVLGSPVGDPDVGVVARALVRLGIEAEQIAISPESRPGATAVLLRRRDGTERVAELFLSDSWDSQLVVTMWRSLRSRAVKPRFPRGRLAQAEHEAAISLLGVRAGAPVLPVLSVASSASGDAAVITAADHQPLSVLTPQQVDALMPAAWVALDRFHASGLIHGGVSLDSLVLGGGGEVLLASFRDAGYGDDPTQRQIDRARLLISFALRVGPRAAVDRARDHLGADELHVLGGYVQTAILDPDQQRALSGAAWKMADLRRRMGVDDTAGVRLALIDRQAATSFVIGGLVLFGVYALITGVDFVAVFQELGNADLTMLLWALLVSLTIPLFFGMSTVGACSSRIPYWPSVVLQNGIQAASLAMPGSAARAALSITYFRRFGVGPVQAVSVGAIDTVAGFLVQVLLLLTILGLGLSDLGAGLDVFQGMGQGEHSALITVVVLFMVLIAAAAIYAAVSSRGREAVRTFRDRSRKTVRESLAQLRSAAGILSQPRKIILLLLGNLGAQLVQATVLLMVLESFGSSAPFIQIVLINTVVSLFAGIAPVPGGIGVAEAGFTACLIAVGIDETTAASTALVFRFITYYLPPAWGAFSLRWLRTHSYL